MENSQKVFLTPMSSTKKKTEVYIGLPIEIIPINKLPLIKKGDELAELICDRAEKQNTPIEEEDIVVITHVTVSKAEGRVIDLNTISPSERAEEIASKVGKPPALVEVILRETKEFVRMGRNSLITETNNGIVCANAGVDKSNVEGESNVALLPKDPDASAQRLKHDIEKLTGCKVAIIISDTHGRPLRRGEINVAIGIAGMKPIRDRRGEKDLYGYVLRMKQTAVADELASAAELVMGQTDEGVPVAIIRGYRYQAAEDVSARILTRPKKADLFRKGEPRNSC